MNPLKMKDGPMLAPSVTEYKFMKEEQRHMAWEILLLKRKALQKEKQLARMQVLMSDALIHKIRAQRRDPYTPEECAARLAAATAERFPQK